MIFIKDFPGKMIGSHRFYGDTLKLKLKREAKTFGYVKFHDYNLHFHFGLFNDESEDAIIRILIDSDHRSELDKPFNTVWISQDPRNRYEMHKIDGKMGSGGRYSFDITIKKGEKKFIANFYPIPFSILQDNIISISRELNCRERNIGTSIEKRNIIAYEIGDTEKKPCLMFLSGYHPPENDPIFLISIMELFKDKKFRERVLENYSLSFLLMVNPDGYYHNMQGSNLNEINFHWNFFDNDKNDCPECHYIWEYCKMVKPIFFMDFHAFTFQNNQARPYIIPPYFYSSSISKKIQKSVNHEFSDLCNISMNHWQQYITSEKILAPNILATRLRKEFGTITSPKYHLHLKDGIGKCLDMSKITFRIIFSILERNGYPNRDHILYRPIGQVRRKLIQSAFSKIIEFFLLRIKPKLSGYKN